MHSQKQTLAEWIQNKIQSFAVYKKALNCKTLCTKQPTQTLFTGDAPA